VGSLLGKTFKELHLCLSLKLDCLGNKRSNLLLGLRNSSLSVSICFGNDLSCIGLGLLNDLSFDKLCLSNNLVVFQIGLGIDLVDQSCGLCLPLGFDS
jgi:hypothetical protein